VGCLLAVILFWPLSFALESEGRGLKGEVSLYWRPVPALFLRGWRLRLMRYTFSGQDALGKTQEKAYIPGKKKKEKKTGKKKKNKIEAVLVKRVLRAVSFRKVRFSLGLGTGDAAFTCMAAGAIHSLFNSLLLVVAPLFGRFPPPPYIIIEPDFREEKLSWRAECIVESRAGNIIIRGLGGFWAVLKRRRGKCK